MAELLQRSAESSQGACTLSQTSTGFLTFTSVTGWPETQVLTVRRWYGSSTPPMLPLSVGSHLQAIKAHSPRTLSLPPWSRGLSRWTYHMPPSAAFSMVRPQRNAEQREAVILWLAKYIAADGEHAEWVAASRLGIRKATLNFVAKFFWLLVRNRVSPTKADNQLTWDRAVMVAALVAGVEIDFTRMLLAEIHERAFKTSTTYPVPWTLDIGLIRDEENVAAPRREPQVEVPPLGINLVDMVGQAQGGDPVIPDHSDTIPASSS
uniref:Integrase core domain containing protein n=1 Tax=Solanum tuberosum TaxID=4113 RepID=M1DMM8_SOLTU